MPGAWRHCSGRYGLLSLHRPLPYTRAIYVMIGEAGGAPAELREALNAHHDAVRSVICKLLTDGIERGEIRADVRVDAQAAALLGTVRGIGTQVLLDPGSVDVRAVTRAVLDATRRALGT
jgi:hypothetical protein